MVAAEGHKERPPPCHGAVLACLDEQGSRATEPAEHSGQHKQAIGTLVDELEAPGHAKREPDPLDRRTKLIVPNGQGAGSDETLR